MRDIRRVHVAVARGGQAVPAAGALERWAAQASLACVPRCPASGSPLGPMSKTKALLQDGGAFGTHAYVNVPICCPSRANILSGKMARALGISLTLRAHCLAWSCLHRARIQQ